MANEKQSPAEELVLPARVEHLERVQAFVADRIGEDCPIITVQGVVELTVDS